MRRSRAANSKRVAAIDARVKQAQEGNQPEPEQVTTNKPESKPKKQPHKNTRKTK